MQIKICGLRHIENIKALLPLQPDYFGFIFYGKSKRYAEGVLDERFTKSLRFSKSERGPIKTGVFVNEEMKKISSIIEKYELSAVQLHGDETVGFCEKLKELSVTKSRTRFGRKNVEILKVFSVDEEFDFSKTKKYEPVCDLFLFDTKGKERGGNGIAFNWEVLKKYDGEKPFFLSGGIGPEDAPDIKKIKHPKLFGVDINSRFELEPGLKNVDAVNKFFNEIKNT